MHFIAPWFVSPVLPGQIERHNIPLLAGVAIVGVLNELCPYLIAGVRYGYDLMRLEGRSDLDELTSA